MTICQNAQNRSNCWRVNGVALYREITQRHLSVHTHAYMVTHDPTQRRNCLKPVTAIAEEDAGLCRFTWCIIRHQTIHLIKLHLIFSTLGFIIVPLKQKIMCKLAASRYHAEFYGEKHCLILLMFRLSLLEFQLVIGWHNFSVPCAALYFSCRVQSELRKSRPTVIGICTVYFWLFVESSFYARQRKLLSWKSGNFFWPPSVIPELFHLGPAALYRSDKRPACGFALISLPVA